MIRLRFHLVWLLLSVALPTLTPTARAQTKLLRFPDIHGDRVVFCYGGDLWAAPASGGKAARLTAQSGLELFPKFSPDGHWIAFTAQYDGDEQVYIIPSDGGEPIQLTFYPAKGPLAPRWGYDNQVYGWSPDGKHVLFRSLRDADGGRVLTALYTVSPDGGLPVQLPMPTSGSGDFSPDGRRMIYSPLFRDFRSWKRYQGGWAQDLYVFDLSSHQATVIAPSARTERDPMWIGDRIYFASDRTGTLNLFAADPASGQVEQLTRSEKWDVRWPSTDHRQRIVYELDGELEVYDLSSRQSRRLAIQVPDDGINRRPSRYPAHKQIESYSLSPKGERALFVARGDIFTAPIEKGSTRNLTDSSNAHDKHAQWSPDGTRVAFISDRTGEDQVWVIDQAGKQPAEQVTTEHKAMLYTPEWSPDGRRLAYSDKDGKLFVLEVESKRTREIVDAPRGGIFDYTWSPQGAFLAFSMNERNQLSTLHVWDADTRTVRRVTSPDFDSSSPAWDPESRYLFFISTREFAPQISSVEWNFAGNRGNALFALALRKDVPNLFAPESDEATPTPPKKPGKKEDPKEKDAKPDPKPFTIDFAGLEGRLVRFPVPADNLGGLTALKGHILYTSSGAGFYGRDSYEKTKLNIFAFKEREASVLSPDIGGYALSHDGSKVLIKESNAYNLYDAKPKAKDKKTVSTSELMVNRVPDQEWLEIFNEVWRRYRDFFYVRNMHGYDWKALGDQYRPLVAHVAHRADLNYVLSELVAELNVGHAYIDGGDFEIPDRPKVGLPGARFELDARHNLYRIARILPGHNAEEKYRSPLTEIGVDARPGDYLLAIDGQELKGNDNPYRLLRHKTHPVTLTLHDKPDLKGARQVTYRPIASEASLLYLEWITRNRSKVEQLTGGRAGYLHIPNMGADGIYEFIKQFYPQIRKEGLVVDVRSNGGGNVSQWIIERLNRKLLGTRFGYDSDEPNTYPNSVLHGHMVCLISETSASDGDIFPSRFRQAGLGPLIGKRSWGGVVGISSRGPLLDASTVLVPLQATNDRDGNYIIEGYGVDPDIVVENDPQSVIQGNDPQLERGVRELLNKIEANPLRLPTRPPDPIKTR